MLASEQSAELELLHVISKQPLDTLREWVRTPVAVADRLIEDVRRVLSDQAAAISAKTNTSPSVVVATGDVLSEIVSSCQRADMLVVGARGNNSLRDAFVGTTAERAIGKCHQPILVVRRPALEAYARVLVPLDFTTNSEKALRVATRIAPRAMFVGLHAYEVPFEARLRLAGALDDDIDSHRLAVEEKAVANISALWQQMGRAKRGFGPIVERGNPAVVIRKQQQSMNADLIVIGKHGGAGVGPFALGSVTRHVLAESVCDVLVLQQPG